MNRTILYYPGIDVPDGPWLRQAILYWDQVATIVPAPGWLPKSPEMRLLEGEGAYRPIGAHRLLSQQPARVVAEFAEELFARLGSALTEGKLPPAGERVFDTRIYSGKVGEGVLKRLITEYQVAIRNPGDSFELRFEPRAARLYMALLAKYLSSVQDDWTVPGTDRADYEEWAFAAVPERQVVGPCATVSYNGVLPVPRADVSLQRLVQFKHSRRDELLMLREELDGFQRKLSEATDLRTSQQVAVQFREKLEKSTMQLNAALDDARISTVAGSLKALIDVKSPAFLTAAAAYAGSATAQIDVPVSWSVAGMAAFGAIQISGYLLERRASHRKAARDCGFAYLYHGHTEGILKQPAPRA